MMTTQGASVQAGCEVCCCYRKNPFAVARRSNSMLDLPFGDNTTSRETDAIEGEKFSTLARVDELMQLN